MQHSWDTGWCKSFWHLASGHPCSSQVLSTICDKLISHQLVNSTEVLKWLREILIRRNKFLLKNKVGTPNQVSLVWGGTLFTIGTSFLCMSLFWQLFSDSLFPKVLALQVNLLAGAKCLSLCLKIVHCVHCTWVLFCSGVCHPWQLHSYLPEGPNQAGGVPLPVPLEPWRRGSAGGHVLLPSPLWGSWHPLLCRRSARSDHPPQLRHLLRVCLGQQHDGDQ